jgi:AcrR family transcriptional regulator
MELRERIIENSMDMFFHRGCKSVTMDEIASENGISKRTLYEQFSDKSTLLEECLVYLEGRMRFCTQKAIEESKNVVEMVRFFHENQSDMMVNLKINFFFELKKFYPEIYKKTYKRFVEFHKEKTIEFLARGQKEGYFLKNIDKDLVSKILIEISNALENSEIFPSKDIPRKDMFRESIVFYFRGISTAKGIELIDSYIDKEYK